MSNAYLDIAEAVIRAARQPLSPREILTRAYVDQLVPIHLHGQTQEKTLQARLSEDISRLREASLFFRTNRARFFLRDFIDDLTIPTSYKIEYLARPRRKDLRHERILAFYGMMGHSANGVISKADLDGVFAQQSYRYLTWPELASDSRLYPVFSFVIFHDGSQVLTHSVGKFRHGQPSQGLRSVGLGSAVRVQDSDLLYDAYHGIIGSAINELVYSVGLPRELARDARYNKGVKIHSALLANDPQIGQHVRAIMSYRCPSDFLVSKASLSLNRLTWVDKFDLAKVRDLDGVSQQLCQSRAIVDLVSAQ